MSLRDSVPKSEGVIEDERIDLEMEDEGNGEIDGDVDSANVDDGRDEFDGEAAENDADEDFVNRDERDFDRESSFDSDNVDEGLDFDGELVMDFENDFVGVGGFVNVVVTVFVVVFVFFD